MKKIKAIIQPFMVEKVLAALDAIEDLPGVTISEISGWGRLPERREAHDVKHGGHGLTKKVKLEIVVRDGLVDQVVEVIAASAHTGNAGDGKIFVSGIDGALRIRTGESDDEAI